MGISSVPLLSANVCDDELLLCQNGGSCIQNQKCVCPPSFQGVLCEQLRCQGEKGCNGASACYLSTLTLLLCLLANSLLKASAQKPILVLISILVYAGQRAEPCGRRDSGLKSVRIQPHGAGIVFGKGGGYAEVKTPS